jgi:F-type H+-transporting ATPase subunit epsilon
MLKLTVVTPERKVLEIECEQVSLPGTLGYFGVLPGHRPLLATLGTGELQYEVGNRSHYLVLQGGFCEVADDRVNVLADIAEEPSEIDVEKAKKAQAAAEERMKIASEHEFKFAQAEAELNLARITVAKKPL